MLTKKEQDAIRRCARKYNASSILLFGSSVEKKRSPDSNDIDLAVKGVNPRAFFEFYAELFKLLSGRVDLVDLDEADNYFAERISEGGRVIYEA